MSQPDASLVTRRLAGLRELMARHGLDVYLVPSSDEHQNEYPPPHKQRRQALCGFTGSAGDLAVAGEQAHLFVDSRYHLQAGQEVPGDLVRVHRVGLDGEFDLAGWLTELEREQGALRVGYDPFVVTIREAERLGKALREADSRLEPLPGNLVDVVWPERPSAPSLPVYALPDSLTGEPVAEKLARVREAMAEAEAGALVLSRLDEVAWLTNLRGADIPYNPVFEGNLLLTPEGAVCYTDTPVPDAVRDGLAGLVAFEPYGRFQEALGTLADGEESVWLDAAAVSEGARLLLATEGVISRSPNPVTALKAVKNPVEITVSREAHLRSGCAKVRSFSRLESMLAEGVPVSEAGYAELLAEEYAREEGFHELSFTTISAFGENGAVVHYSRPDPERMLEPGGLLLVDSGIQLTGATTDDTRTIAIGVPDEEQRRHFTGVLRAHIRLAMQIFPQGTTGQMLDTLARSPLWNEGADYGHGTGHGVGAFLNVHEGPQSISMRGTVPLEAGMIVSNEPGYYRAGWGGIRCENLYVVEEALGLPHHPAGKTWLRLSPLTLIPFDRSLIDASRLMEEERDWLDGYHRLVEENLAPRLETPYRHWLSRACTPLGN